ncbi:serine/threonine-protein phosphatase 4 regulatory subunit 1-like isoform X2 [Bacillus rossius redtenbacheri]
MGCRLLLDTLRVVADCRQEVADVMATVARLANDQEAAVRSELMEHLPNIAMLCHEDKHRLQSLVVDDILPLVVRNLADSDNHVRKWSQEALMVLMEQGLIDMQAVEERVCPMILTLTELDSLVELHSCAVTLMSKMAPLIGQAATEKFFLDRFALLCGDSVFYVRKVCATNFGEFCSVVSTQSIENTLLPRFVDLCSDKMWGVRKACAEVFMSVSCACTMEMRKGTLASLFVNLLSDVSRWVRMSAFQTLGPFISTFTDPRIMGLAYNRMGELTLINPEGEGYKFILSRLNASQVSDSELARVIADSKSYQTNSSTKAVTNAKSFSSHFQKLERMETMSVDFWDSESSGHNQSVVMEEMESNSAENCGMNQLSCRTSSVSEEGSDCADAGWVVDDRTSGGGDARLDRGAGASEPESRQLRVREDAGKLQIHVEAPGERFNAFQFWRVPVPNIELDISLTEDGKPAAVRVTAKVTDEVTQRTFASELSVDMDIECELDKLATRLEQCQPSCGVRSRQAQICTANVATVSDPEGSDSTVVGSCVQQAAVVIRPGGEVNTTVNRTKFKLFNSHQDFNLDDICNPLSSRPSLEVKQPESCGDFAQESFLVHHANIVQQNLVPQLLIDHYVSMTHPSLAQNTDNDITRYCAFSLPAVVLTLGRENWPLLKEMYGALASDLQWKVRRTVASSIHELAVILGEDIATSDLVPIYNGFIKDVDEVRIGALKHLADFLKLVKPYERSCYLPKLSLFLMTDNESNWRFREELAEQLLMSTNLFSPVDVRKHLTPLAITLLLDRVAAVRHVALYLMTQLVRSVGAEVALARGVAAEIAEQFAHSTRWGRRHTFALLCSRLVAERVLPEDQFASDVLPHLLDLSWDRVPNVRLAVARTLSLHVLAQRYFASNQSPHYELLMQVVKRLQSDVDRDVRFFAVVQPRHTEQCGSKSS